MKKKTTGINKKIKAKKYFFVKLYNRKHEKTKNFKLIIYIHTSLNRNKNVKTCSSDYIYVSGD